MCYRFDRSQLLPCELSTVLPLCKAMEIKKAFTYLEQKMKDPPTLWTNITFKR